jgi:hypothetical protein
MQSDANRSPGKLNYLLSEMPVNQNPVDSTWQLIAINLHLKAAAEILNYISTTNGFCCKNRLGQPLTVWFLTLLCELPCVVFAHKTLSRD